MYLPTCFQIRVIRQFHARHRAADHREHVFLESVAESRLGHVVQNLWIAIRFTQHDITGDAVDGKRRIGAVESGAPLVAVLSLEAEIAHANAHLEWLEYCRLRIEGREGGAC